MNFELHLEDNLFCLYEELQSFSYKHSLYKHFQIFDNKKRDIYKAEVRDRVVHQIVYDYLLFLYEPEFISDSYASRVNKGQYKAIKAFRYFIKLAGKKANPVWVLKCDVRKYFDSINQVILLNIIKQRVTCRKIFGIIEEIITSYSSDGVLRNDPVNIVKSFHRRTRGIPLGNITSQIFANIYLNILDKYVKNQLKCRFYVRYNDDFLIVSDSIEKLVDTRTKIFVFAKEKLSLVIPISKTSIRKISWGIDYLGFTILPKAVLLRNKTKNKIYVNISTKNIQSYFGILKHCNSFNPKRKIMSMGEFDEI